MKRVEICTICKFLIALFLSILFFPTRAMATITVLGDIGGTPPEASTIADWVLQKSLGVAGGVAFLMMIFGGFQYMMSNGDPNKLQEATDIVTSAIAGLMLIIFSVVILNLLGNKLFMVF